MAVPDTYLTKHLTIIAAREFSPADQHLQHSHSHEHAQLHYLSAGSARFSCAQRLWHLVPGRWCWIAPGVPHQLHSLQATSGMVFQFAAESVKDWPLTSGLYQTNPLLQQLLQRALQRFRQQQMPELQRISTVLADELRGASADPWNLIMPQQGALLSLCEQILQQVYLAYPLPQLAASCGFSQRSFGRHFQAQTGMSFTAWLKHARMFCAAQLLAQGSPVKLVAAEVGYQSLSSFTQSFTEVSGSSPARWQQNLHARDGCWLP